MMKYADSLTEDQRQEVFSDMHVALQKAIMKTEPYTANGLVTSLIAEFKAWKNDD